MKKITMKKITTDFFEKIDIVDVVSEVVQLKRVGSQYRGLCPFHNERTPSFYVSPIGVYHCFGCGESGNVIKFVMKVYGYDYEEAISYLARKFNIPLPEKEDKNYELYQILNYTAEFYFENLKKNARVINYLRSRGLNEKSIIKFKIGYADDKFDIIKNLVDKGFSTEKLFQLGLVYKDNSGNLKLSFVNRIMFPIFSSNGKYVIGFSGRSLDGSDPKYKNSQDSEVFKKRYAIYAFNFAKSSIVKNKFAIVVEGFFDVIALHQLGYENTISFMGTNISDYQAQMLKKYIDKVYLFFDNDSAGKKATIRSLGTLLKAGLIPYILVGDRNRDPDEIVMEGGLEKLIKNPYNINSYFRMLYESETSIEGKMEILRMFRESFSDVNENNFGSILIEEIKPYLNELYKSLKLKLNFKEIASDTINDEVYALWNVYKSSNLRPILDELDEDVFSSKAREIFRAIKSNTFDDENFIKTISKIEFSNKELPESVVMKFIGKWKERKAMNKLKSEKNLNSLDAMIIARGRRIK